MTDLNDELWENTRDAVGKFSATHFKGENCQSQFCNEKIILAGPIDYDNPPDCPDPPNKIESDRSFCICDLCRLKLKREDKLGKFTHHPLLPVENDYLTFVCIGEQDEKEKRRKEEQQIAASNYQSANVSVEASTKYLHTVLTNARNKFDAFIRGGDSRNWALNQTAGKLGSLVPHVLPEDDARSFLWALADSSEMKHSDSPDSAIDSGLKYGMDRPYYPDWL